MEVGVDDVSSSDTDLVLRLGCAGGTAIPTDRHRRRPDSMKSEPSASNPMIPAPSLTLGISDAAGVGHQDRALSASFSNVKKETDPGFEMAEKLSPRGSDIDEEDGGGARKKLRLTKEQSALLEDRFKEHNTLSPKQKVALAKQLNLRPRQVEVWFQNRRARTKLKQTEVDCEFLRRCCEALRDENRRLSRELQELKALKPPLYMRLPAAAAALTVCPSCERVAGGAGNGSKAAAAFSAGSEKALFLSPFNHSATC